MIVREGFLREGRSVIGHGHHGGGYCLEHHDWLGSILDRIDITGNQFKLGILVSLSRSIIDGHPATDICLSLILTQRHRVIRFPRKSSSPVCYLAIGGDGLVAEYLPVEGGQGEEAIGQGWEVDAFDVIEHLYAIVGLEDVPGVVAQEGSVEFVALISQLGVDLYFLVDVFFEDGVGVDQVSFVILLKDTDALRGLQCLEGDRFGLDIG